LKESRTLLQVIDIRTKALQDREARSVPKIESSNKDRSRHMISSIKLSESVFKKIQKQLGLYIQTSGMQGSNPFILALIIFICLCSVQTQSKERRQAKAFRTKVTMAGRGLHFRPRLRPSPSASADAEKRAKTLTALLIIKM
jgi:hypothetical protein